MEFFEFDNSFISDKGKQTTKFDERGNGGTTINGEHVSCFDIGMYKASDSIVVVGGKDTSCINDMPYRAKLPNAFTKTNINKIDAQATGALRKF